MGQFIDFCHIPALQQFCSFTVRKNTLCVPEPSPRLGQGQSWRLAVLGLASRDTAATRCSSPAPPRTKRSFKGWQYSEK